jgi:hypothetical protein
MCRGEHQLVVARDDAWAAYARETAAELGVPVCDPMRGGVAPIAEALLEIGGRP